MRRTGFLTLCPKPRIANCHGTSEALSAKAAAVHRLMHKFQCKVSSIVLRMGMMRYQTELKTKMQKVVDDVGTVYSELGTMLKSGSEKDDQYQPILRKYVELKNTVEKDVDEAEGVVASACRVKAAKQDNGGQKRKSKKGSLKAEPVK